MIWLKSSATNGLHFGKYGVDLLFETVFALTYSLLFIIASDQGK